MVKNDFQGIMDNLQSKLSGWKTEFLNIAGRTTLVKSTLGHMATHLMQYIKLPCYVTNHLDRVQRNFIWGTTNSTKKLHMINWDTVVKNKELGGLNIQKSRVKNDAMLTKLAWRLYKNPNSLWASLLTKKYTRIRSFITLVAFLETVAKFGIIFPWDGKTAPLVVNGT